MRRQGSSRSSELAAWVGRLVWLAVGVVVAWQVIQDPWDLHSLDDRLSGHEAVLQAADDEVVTELWICPMHPHILEEDPGTCPICGMDLVPAGDPSEVVPAPNVTGRSMQEDRDAASGTIVEIDPVVVQNMNVRSVEVVRRDLKQRIRTVGYLEFDQERMVTVTTKYRGWIEKVYVNYIGQPVEAGQPLFEIYSPELVQTQQELLSARQYAERLAEVGEQARQRAEALVEAARARLHFWDISPAQIEELESSREIVRTLQVVAPSRGLIMKRLTGLEGMAVEPGMEIFHIADLSTLWLSVEVFENQLVWIGEGTAADIEFSYFPGQTFRGVVQYIEPEFSERTRTLRVKLAVPNPAGRLRPGMFATVEFAPVAVAEALAVPTLAVLRTGERDVVVVDLGSGRFEPRPVTLGHVGEGYVAVLAGLEEGERVVTSAQFLIDSEASLQEAIQKMRTRHGDHGQG